MQLQALAAHQLKIERILDRKEHWRDARGTRRVFLIEKNTGETPVAPFNRANKNRLRGCAGTGRTLEEKGDLLATQSAGDRPDFGFFVPIFIETIGVGFRGQRDLRLVR